MVNQLQDIADIVNVSTLTDMPRSSVRRRARGEGGPVDLSGNVSKLSAAAGHSLTRSPHIRTYSGSPIVRFTYRHCRARLGMGREGGQGASGFVYSHPDSLRGDPLSCRLRNPLAPVWVGCSSCLTRCGGNSHIISARARSSSPEQGFPSFSCAPNPTPSPASLPGDADCIVKSFQ